MHINTIVSSKRYHDKAQAKQCILPCLWIPLFNQQGGWRSEASLILTLQSDQFILWVMLLRSISPSKRSIYYNILPSWKLLPSQHNLSSPGHLRRPWGTVWGTAAAEPVPREEGSVAETLLLRHGTARHGTARHGTARHDTARHGTAAIGRNSTPLQNTTIQLLRKTGKEKHQRWVSKQENCWDAVTWVQSRAFLCGTVGPTFLSVYEYIIKISWLQ